MEPEGLLRLHGEVARVLAAARTAEEIIRPITESVVAGLGWDMGVFWVASNEKLTAAAIVHSVALDASALLEATQQLVLEPGQEMPGATWFDRTPRWLQDPGFERASVAKLAGIAAGIWVPVVADQRVVGVLEVMRRAGAEREELIEEALVAIGRHVGSALDRCAMLGTRDKLGKLDRSDVMGIVVAGGDGSIVEANETFLAMVKRTRAELQARALRWDLITPAKWIEPDEEAMRELLATGSVTAYEKEYIRPDGSVVPVLVGGALLEQSPPTAIAFVIDISKQKASERALEELNRELETRIADREQRVRSLAARLDQVREEQLAEVSREIHDVLGQGLTGLALDTSWVRRRLAKLVETAGHDVNATSLAANAQPVIARLDGSTNVAPDKQPAIERVNGSRDFADDTQAAIERVNESTNFATNMQRAIDASTDATAQRAIERLDASTDVTAPRAIERLDASTNPTMQRVNATKVAALDEIAATAHHAIERLDGVLRGLDEMMVKVRQIATELRPRILDDLGLVAAIQSHARDLAERSGLELALELPADVELRVEVATAAFRIYQELITNVIRHAQATRVTIALTAGTELELRVQDDGRGISAETLAGARSLGLLGMQERARALGGHVAFLEAPRGTGVRVTIPT